MPISRQLSLSLLLILLLTFTGTLWTNVNNARAFIEQQLGSHAQDAATSLGLSIAPYMDNETQLSTVDTMMNAIFDSGYYRSMVLTNMEGLTLLEKHNPGYQQQVPDWFINLFPLLPPKGSSEINNGWYLSGVLTVTSHPGIGHVQLWSNALESFWLFTGIFIGALLFISLLVKVITTPILAVVKQAKAISEQKFDKINHIPRTPELRIFVEALNAMAEKLADMFRRLTEQTEQYRDYAYTDPLTKVGNRRAFDLIFKQQLNDQQPTSNNYLILIRLSSLEYVNRQIGYVDGDLYIQAVAQALIENTRATAFHSEVFRLNGADFAVLLEDSDEVQCTSLLKHLLLSFNAIEKTEYHYGTAHMGVSAFRASDSYHDILELADNALAHASQNPQRWQLASQLQILQSNSVWRDQLHAILQDNKADFASQAIKSATGVTLYSEWFARFKLQDTQCYLPMSQLIPASVRLNYTQQLDALLFNCFLQKVDHIEGRVGLNLSRLSLSKAKFQQWILQNLVQNSAACAKLVLEIPERAVVSNGEKLGQFVQQIKQLGVGITIERFGAQLASISQLRQMQPDYLKIDGRYTRNIANQPDNQLFVGSLVNIAHGLNIEVIAELVESEQDAAYLRSLNIDYLQGYYIQLPQEPA